MTVAPDTALERSVFYHPNKEHYSDRPEGVEAITVTTKDGLQLQAWFLKATEKRPLVVYFHGNGGNLTVLNEMFALYKKLDVGVLAIDYRGFGDSPGEPSEEGLYLDGQAAYDEAVRRGFKPEQIFIHGRSLGGGVATKIARDNACRGLILESTLTSAQDVARFAKGEQAARLIDGFNSLARMPDLKMPVLVMHGDQDDTIPCEQGQKLHEAYPNSTYWVAKGGDHNNLKENPDYEKQLKSFLDR